MNSASTTANETTVKVWDIYLRLFHWALVAAITVSFVSVQFDAMEVHTTSGICVVVLLVFRLIWGVTGSTTAKFHNFVRGPKTVLAYLRSSAPDETSASETYSETYSENQTTGLPAAPHPGHTPLGALSVIGMLAVLLAQVGTGLFADDEVYTTGPLAQFVSLDFSLTATAIHGINAKIVLLLIVVHLAAIAFYLLVKKNNLILPMLNGRKTYSAEQAARYDYLRMGGLIMALSALALALAAGLWLYSL